MKKDSFKKKLAAYIVMSEAFLLAHPIDADAQIMYTDVNPDLVIHNSYFNLDLNNDGVTDFKITQYKFQSSYHHKDSELIEGYGENGVVVDILGNPMQLVSGATIGMNQMTNIEGLFHSTFYTYMLSYPGSPFFNDGGGGIWIDNAIRYVGLKLVTSSTYYYGWLRLKVYNENIYIYDYAVNQIKHHPIMAGAPVTGVNEIESFPFQILFVNKKLLFHLAENSLMGNQIDILNGLGQLVATVTVTNQTPEADLSALPAGIYFYHIRSKQKTYSGKFFIE